MLDQMLSKSREVNSLPFRLERFEGIFAVLVFEEGERMEVKWPIKKLPEGMREGQKVWLQLSNEESRKEEKEEILRGLLEEIIS